MITIYDISKMHILISNSRNFFENRMRKVIAGIMGESLQWKLLKQLKNLFWK